MAATATQQIINNGPRNLVVKYVIDGTTGDTAAGTLVDVSAIDTAIGVNGLTLVKAAWALDGFSVVLLWDATSDVSILELSGSDCQDYREFGGIKNNAGTGATGDVNWTSIGYTAAGGGHIVLHFRKT